MARTKLIPPDLIVERNLTLTGELMRYLGHHPHLLQALPDRFELVILPDDDPEMRLYNLELLDRYVTTGKPIVFARVHSGRLNLSQQDHPRLYVPVGVS